MINIIHHEELENHKIVRDYYSISDDKQIYGFKFSKEELIELREKLNELDKKFC